MPDLELGIGSPAEPSPLASILEPVVNHRDWARRVMSPTMLERYERKQAESVVFWEKFNKETVIKQFFLDRSSTLLPLSRALIGTANEAGCGFSALSLITCEHPELIKLKLGKKGISAQEMVDYLRAKDYEVTDLDDELLKPADNWVSNYVTAFNVVLVCVRATADKNTWGVVWGDHLLHNWATEDLQLTTFINHHILNRYLIWHPSWVSNADLRETIKKSKNEKQVDQEGYHNQTHAYSDAQYRDNSLFEKLFSKKVSKLVI